MASSDDDLYQTVIERLGDLVKQWQFHKETVNRAIGLLADEVFRFQQRMDADDQKREDRQKVVDAKLDSIERWQRLRLLVEVALILVIAAALLGKALL